MNKDKYKKLKEKIIKAVPEIMELKIKKVIKGI